jgi:TonB family protein
MTRPPVHQSRINGLITSCVVHGVVMAGAVFLTTASARIEGAVLVECVVQPSGTCARLRVVRSLDPRLGLDEQALRAAAGWRFSPGTRLGEPVAVVVTIQLGFFIH